MNILGKRRYKKEFLFLNNQNYILQWYLKFFYNVNIKFFLDSYKFLKKKFYIKTIKDVFVFLEYNISIFVKKYLFFSLYTFNNINLNNNKYNDNMKTFFFIGDLIKIDNKHFFYHEKFILFFNFIYFISPISLKIKEKLLYSLYQKVYFFFMNQ